MIKHFVILFFILIPLFSIGQSRKYIKGQLKLLNSPVYVSGINIKVSYHSVDFTDVTKTDGIFLLGLPESADIVEKIDIVNRDYEIVEPDDVKKINTIEDISRKPELILICKKGELRKLSNRYFEAMFEKVRLKYDSRLAALKNANSQDKEGKVALDQEITNLKIRLRQQADFYSKFDLSDPLYKEAYEHFLKGEYNECLQYLPSDQVITAAASSLQGAKNKIIKIDLLKASSYDGLNQYAKADKFFVEAINADQLNLDSYISYANALARRGNKNKSLNYRIKAVAIAEMFNKDDCTFLINNYELISFAYEYSRTQEDSAIYFKRKNLKVLEIAASTGKFTQNTILSSKAYLYSSFGHFYLYRHKILDSAIYYFNLELGIYSQLKTEEPKSIINYAKAAQDIGNCYIDKENLDSAFFYYREGYSILKSHIKNWPEQENESLFTYFEDLVDFIEDDIDKPEKTMAFVNNEIAFYEQISKTDKKYAYFLSVIYDYMFALYSKKNETLAYKFAILDEKNVNILRANSGYFKSVRISVGFLTLNLKEVYTFLSSYYDSKHKHELSKQYSEKLKKLGEEKPYDD